MKTYSNVGNAKRAAKKAGLDTKTLNFVTVDGRTSWSQAKTGTLAAMVLAARDAATDTTAKEESVVIPTATIKGQGQLQSRKANGINLATKSGRVRALIASEFDVANPNPEHCIALIRSTEGFTRNLGRVYFANNLPKVFPQFAE